MKNIHKEFGKKVRYFREQMGLTQWKLAEQANLHNTYIGAIERGEKNITLKNINKIATALNIKITDLLDFKQPKSNKISPDNQLKIKISRILENKSEEEIDKFFKILKEISKLQDIK